MFFLFYFIFGWTKEIQFLVSSQGLFEEFITCHSEGAWATEESLVDE